MIPDNMSSIKSVDAATDKKLEMINNEHANGQTLPRGRNGMKEKSTNSYYDKNNAFSK